MYIITKSSPLGGAQRYVYDIATGLADRYEPVVVVGGDGELKRCLEEVGIRTISICALERDIRFVKDLKVFGALFRIVRREHPDIVHVNSSKAGGLGALAARLLSVPKIVFTVHGWPFRERRGRTARMLIMFFSWLTAFLAHHTVLVSEADRLAARRMPLVRQKFVVIRNGRAPLAFVSRAAARERVRTLVPALRDDARHTVWVGAMGELTGNKAFSVLVWAFRAIVDAHPRARCIIVGEGEERGALLTLIGHLGLDRHVFLTGYIGATDVLPAFDIFVLPSFKEGLPYVILEAGQAGLPVIASTTGGVSEIIEDGTSGILVHPGRTGAVVRKITFLLEHPDTRQEYGKALRKVVTERFSLERMLRETDALYQRDGRGLQASRGYAILALVSAVVLATTICST